MNKYFHFLIFIAISCTSKVTEPPTEQILMEKNNKMRSLGLIGGVSWHSTIDYYQSINQSVNEHYKNNTNPPLVVYTINQADVHRFQKENKWDSIAYMLTSAALKLRSAGTEAVMFCANTPHKVFDQVQAQLDFPVIHIGDATAKEIKRKAIAKVGFIGTKYTMEDDFITKRLRQNGIEVLLPEDQVVTNELQRIIEEELTYGTITTKSKQYVMDVLQSMIDKGAEGLVLGCTEFPLMITQDDFSIPVFNTTEIHSQAAVDFILTIENEN